MTWHVGRRSVAGCTLVLLATAVAERRVHAQPAPDSRARGGASTALKVERILVGSPVQFRVMDQQELFSRTTIAHHFGSLQSIDGWTLTITPGVRVMRHDGKYFVVPEGARFATAFYGHFCGAGWGVGSGNDSRAPIADGGLDAACRAHDEGWSKASRPGDVRSADASFANALAAIRPRWSYEAKYRDAALRWMECRRSNGVDVKSFKETKCGGAAVWPVVRASISRVVPR